MEKSDSKKKREDFFKFYREQHPTPYFEFENIKETERLEYEILSESNYHEIYEMFKNDKSKFVQAEYKNIDLLKEYLNYQLNYNRFSPKRGACDWLFKLKDGGDYVGLLNVYELSRETFANNHKKCMIGFTTRTEFRRKYYTTEAVRSLIEHVFRVYKLDTVIANTDKANKASKFLMEKIGFEEVTEKFYYAKEYDFFEFKRKH